MALEDGSRELQEARRCIQLKLRTFRIVAHRSIQTSGEMREWAARLGLRHFGIQYLEAF
jgi:hypothetical protein